MTGPEHYRLAERLAEIAAKDGDDRAAAQAQVHATLALAAATGLALGNAEGRVWRAVAGSPLEKLGPAI